MIHTPHRPGCPGVEVPCTDAMGRERQVGAWVRPLGGRVVLRVSPGEVALLTPTQARTLVDHLTALATAVDGTDTASTRRDPWTRPCCAPSSLSPTPARSQPPRRCWAAPSPG
jgi:hypothetical protein